MLALNSILYRRIQKVWLAHEIHVQIWGLSPFESTDFCSFSTRPMPTRCWSSVRPSLRWLAEQTKRQWSSVLRYWSTWTRCIWLVMKLGTWNLGIKQHSQLVIDHYAMDWWFIPPSPFHTHLQPEHFHKLGAYHQWESVGLEFRWHMIYYTWYIVLVWNLVYDM